MHQPKDITAFTPGETPAGATRTPFGRIAAGLNRFAEWLTAPVAQKNGRRSTVAVYQAFILMAASLSFALAALLGAAITFAMYSPMDIRPQILTVCAVFYASLPMLRRVGVGLDWEKTLFFTASFTVVFCFGLDPGAMRTAGITTFLPILVGMGAPLYSTFGIAVLAAVALTVSGSLTLIDLARFEPVAGGLTQGEVGMMGVRNIATIVCATIISLFGRQIYEQLILNVKATRDRARRANEMKGAFLANLSHEVRTPLNAIVGLTDILKHKGDLSDQKALLDTISRSGHDLLVTLNDVLDVAQLEAGQMQVRPAPHHMPEFLRNMRHMWQPLIEERGLVFRLDVDPDIPDEVELDAGRLRQCVNNLMSNAAKFTDVGEVHVTLRWHAGDPALLEIEVCDTGIGIPLDRQAHLMQPFEQAVDGAVERPQGSGLGLYISREIARMLGGDLTFKSVPGVGTAFTLTVQVWPVQHRVPEAEFLGKRALIVNAVSCQQLLLQNWLSGLGLDVTCCVTGENALNLLRGGGFDVVLIDTHLPDFAWGTLCKRIEAMEGADVPPVILTLQPGTPVRIGVETSMPMVRTPVAERYATPTLRAALTGDTSRAQTCGPH